MRCKLCKTKEAVASRFRWWDLFFLLILRKPVRCACCGSRRHSWMWIEHPKPEKANPQMQVTSPAELAYVRPTPRRQDAATAPAKRKIKSGA